MPQTPKKLKRLKKSFTGRRERASNRQIKTITRFDEEYSQRERQNNLIYNQTKRCRTYSPKPSTSRQPTEMELMLTNLEITEYAQSMTHHNLNCDFLNPDIALETEPEPADSSGEEEVHCVPIVSNNIRTRKPHLTCALDGSFAVAYYDLGPLALECEFCKALHFDCEKIGTKSSYHFRSCCHDKKVMLPQTRSHPLLEELLMNNNTSKRHYLENIRKYNSAMSFASFVANEAIRPNGRGPYLFKINGQVHYKFGPLHPENTRKRSYAQLYIIDTAEATDRRMSMNSTCDSSLMAKLHEMMLEVNPLAQKYRMMAEVESAENELAQREGRTPFEVRMFLLSEQPDISDQSKNRFNLPSADEIAAVFTTKDGDPPAQYDLKVFPKGDGTGYLRNINSLHQLTDPMLYPLLFPYGERGWDMNKTHERETNGRLRKVTRLQYVAFRIAIRREFTLLHNSGKLWLQYLVDQYVRVEGERLMYQRTQIEQKKLRVETYAGLQDYLYNEAAERGVQPGKIVILPSSFQGSPRNMNMHYQDAMALVRAFGKPSLFITFTCNPKWKEITDNLGYASQSNFRPELIARVFKAKLEELMNDLTKKEVFGKVLYYLYVIEFQKRGLPHCHILLTLAEEYAIREVEHIDKVVSAEFPEQSDAILFEVVKSCMIHGPCGSFNPSSPCMKNGKCTKNFPKPFCPITKENFNGYPVYKRRNDGKRFLTKVNDRLVEMTNEWVVPYNPYLSRKFQAHINVEVCSTVKAVKYLHKYIYKGYDSTNVKTVNVGSDGRIDYDEISRFVNMRYVSAPEACWRLLEFPMQAKSHSVQKLAVHLPEHQNVYIQEDADIAAIVQQEHVRTTLTAFFELNTNDPDARNKLYQDIPKEYIFENKRWKKRKNKRFAIGRVYTVSPKHEETFALRLLLVSVPGPKSFTDLRTVNGSVYKTFKGAAIARNLFESDSQFEVAIEEAASHQMPKQLRAMFAYLCAFCNLKEPFNIFLKFEIALTEDFSRSFSMQVSRTKALCEIGSILMSHSIALSDLGFPAIDLEVLPNAVFDPKTEEELAKQMIPNLNTNQKIVFDHIWKRVLKNEISTNAFFISGAGGCGKTYLYETLLHFFRGKGIKCSAVAWTGIAAMLLPGGRTSHSVFKFPIPVFENSVSSIKPSSKAGHEIRETKVFIFDEASMIPSNALYCLDRLLRDIQNNDMPFGGKVLILGGDFQQVLPVVPHAARATIIENCLISCTLWDSFEKFTLTENMRTNPGEVEFNRLLLDVGSGSANASDTDFIQIPREMLCHGDLIERIYGPDIANLSEQDLKSKAILCPKNSHCLEINNKIIQQLPGTEMTYHSLDSIVTEDESERMRYPVEFLHSIEMSGLPPHTLCLKPGAVVMLIRNLDVRKGLVNGTRLIIKSLHPNTISVEILSGEFMGTVHTLTRIPLTPSDSTFPFTIKRLQIPIILSFAMTINKSQGQTLGTAGIYLPEPVFSHGMLYVALSRVRSKGAVAVKITHEDSPGRPVADGWTHNIVFSEILN